MISPKRTLAITRRILHEQFRDTRSRVLVIITPGLLLVLVRYLFDSAEDFSPTGALMLGVFPALTMFLIGSTSIVGERSKGTLEAVLATPASKLDLIAGYATAAVLASLAQAVCTVSVAYGVSGLSTASPPWLLGLLTMLSGIFGMSIGILVSSICRNEGEAFQFLPGVMVPQLLVSGLVFPVGEMANWVQQLERVLPLTTATRAMAAAREHSFGGASLVANVIAMACLIALALVGAAATIRRRTA
nr:ABC transporter permease [Streptomyces sp. NBC_00886]